MGLKELLGLKGKFKDSSLEALNESAAYNVIQGTINPSTTDFNFGTPEGNFIGDSFYDTGGVFGGRYNQAGLLEVERSYIMQQRAISMYPEVAIGIEEIMRDLFDKLDPLSLTIHAPSDDDDAIYEAFNKFKAKPFTIIGDTKTPKNLIFFNLLKQVYIDGHMVILACDAPEDWTDIDYPSEFYKPYKPKDEKKPHFNSLNETSKFVNISESIVHSYHLEAPKEEPKEYKNLDKNGRIEWLIEAQSEGKKVEDASKLVFVPLDPARIVIDYQTNEIRYDIRRGTSITLDQSKVIMADFGLFDIMGARYGFLQYAFKYANQLQSLQDMLVPMRFRRSIARRVFNVDVGNLPQARATEYMQGLQTKFKYRKSYDVKNGRVSSQDKDPIGLVEDYWFANRAGGKGTTVDMIDEAGNFADSLEDILYFNKKLYQSMFIPLRRVFESDAEYDYTNSSIEVDELRFHGFLERLRFVYSAVMTKMFHIYLIKSGLVKKEDFVKLENFEVLIRYDNWFAENKKFEKFEKALGLFEDALTHLGKAYSAETMMHNLFGYSVDDLKNESEKINSEKEDGSIFKVFYDSQGEDDGY